MNLHVAYVVPIYFRITLTNITKTSQQHLFHIFFLHESLLFCWPHKYFFHETRQHIWLNDLFKSSFWWFFFLHIFIYAYPVKKKNNENKDYAFSMKTRRKKPVIFSNRGLRYMQWKTKEIPFVKWWNVLLKWIIRWWRVCAPKRRLFQKSLCLLANAFVLLFQPHGPIRIPKAPSSEVRSCIPLYHNPLLSIFSSLLINIFFVVFFGFHSIKCDMTYKSPPIICCFFLSKGLFSSYHLIYLTNKTIQVVPKIMVLFDTLFFFYLTCKIWSIFTHVAI